MQTVSGRIPSATTASGAAESKVPRSAAHFINTPSSSYRTKSLLRGATEKEKMNQPKIEVPLEVEDHGTASSGTPSPVVAGQGAADGVVWGAAVEDDEKNGGGDTESENDIVPPRNKLESHTQIWNFDSSAVVVRVVNDDIERLQRVLASVSASRTVVLSHVGHLPRVDAYLPTISRSITNIYHDKKSCESNGDGMAEKNKCLRHHWWWTLTRLADMTEFTDFLLLEQGDELQPRAWEVLELLQRVDCSDCFAIALGDDNTRLKDDDTSLNDDPFRIESFREGPVLLSREMISHILSLSPGICAFHDYDWNWRLRNAQAKGLLPYKVVVPTKSIAKLTTDDIDRYAADMNIGTSAIADVSTRPSLDLWYGGQGTPPYEADEGKCIGQRGAVKGITLRGERHTGTGWLRQLVNSNMPELEWMLAANLDMDGKYGWKHGLLDKPVEEDDLLVVIFRDAISWLPKMRVENYEAQPRNNLPMGQFLRAKFKNKEKLFLPNGEVADKSEWSNAMEMRTVKYKSWYDYTNSHERAEWVTYESLKQDQGKSFIQYLCNKYDMYCTAEFQAVTSYAKFLKVGSSTFQEKKAGKWEDEHLCMALGGLDLKFERAIGYKYEDIDQCN